MRYLLDTNICIYAMKQSVPVLRRMRDAGRDRLFINTLVLAELAFGVARSAEARRAANRALLQRFAAALEVLAWPEAAAWIHGEQRQLLRCAGTPIGDMDLLIAAHALADDLVLVTNNLSEFSRVPGLKLENWAE